MKEERPFYVLRYSLVEESQQTLVPKPLPSLKGAAVIDAIGGDREFSQNGVEYAFIGFKEVVPTDQFKFPEGRFFTGKTAKHGKTHVGERIPGDIVEYIEDDWIPVITIFDVVEQYIFVQKDWRFGTETQTAGAIQRGIRDPILDVYNHRAFVEPVTTKEWFWRVIGHHKKIYKLQLNLISPNILETNRKARDALEALENVFNQDETKIVLESEAGKLVVPEVPTADYVDYIAEGEGSWSVVVDGGPRGGKKTFTSKENVETIQLHTPDVGGAQSGPLFDQDANAQDDGRSSDASRAAQAFTWAAKRLRKN